MLVLTRKVGEALVFELPDGRKIEVTIVRKTNANEVAISIDADKDIIVKRKEIC